MNSCVLGLRAIFNAGDGERLDYMTDDKCMQLSVNLFFVM